jgi:hypothetical protein
MACHMPKKNMGLDGRLTRYHRIGSPTEPSKVMLARPLECALCHTDKTVAQLVDSMERWWGKRYDRGALTRLYGGGDALPLLETARSGKPHERAVAFAVLGQAKRRDAIPLLLDGVADEYPIVRAYAESALESLLGERSPLDLDGERDELKRAAAAWAARGSR